MKTRAYSVYDRKALIYHMPYYALTDAVAVRTLADAMTDPNTSFGRHPNDYVLFFVGEFDDSNGQLWPEQPLKHVIDAQALVKALQSEIPFPEGTTTDKPSSTEAEAQRRNGLDAQVRDRGGNV